MDKASTKILKILLFVGVFGYLQYYDISRGVHTIDSVTAGLMMASAAYLIASLFGILLALFSNYFIAIVATGALALFLAFKLDEIAASTSWLSEGLAAAILGVLAALCLVRDILTVKKLVVPSKAVKEEILVGAGRGDPNVIMQNNMKFDPQSVLNLSNMLEKQWGRKPSYDEVMDYIDHLAIPED